MMKIILIPCLIMIVIVARPSSGSRILGIYPVPIKSHFIMINGLLQGLAKKGHQVDVISVFPPSKEKLANYKQIMQFPESIQDLFSKIFNITGFSLIQNFNRNISAIGNLGNMICKMTMESQEFMELIRNPPKDKPYDLIITHAMNYPCLMVVGHLWNVPVVLVSTTSLYPWMHDMIGNPENIAFSPNNMIAIEPANNGFRTRFLNFCAFYMLKLSYLYYTSQQSEILRKYFGPDVPSIRELENSVSLTLMNTYFPINGAKPMATGLVEVGGLHIQDDGPELDTELKNWLDESKNGVIYFTLGSSFRIETFPEEITTILFKKLEKVKPIRVLIRILKPEEMKVKIPDNFKALPWISQIKVLQHPYVKIFITHGGLLGSQESIYYGIPMLCLPLMADQWTNTYNYISKEIAVAVDIMSITQEKFDHAVDTILNNSTYRDNVKRLSKLFRDRPQSAMDTATFWIEFVIRNGKDSLRSLAMDLTWWQIALLDVYAVLILALIIVLSIVIFIVRMLLRLLCSRKNWILSHEKKRN